jgi:tetratricopeptide (TPR) repeat protein
MPDHGVTKASPARSLFLAVMTTALLLLLAGGAWAQAAKPAAKQPAKADAAAPADSAPACLEAGHQALGQRDFPGAAKLFAECAKANPKNPVPAYWEGMAHFLAHQAIPAREALEKCLAKFPGYLPAMAILGKLYSFDKDKLGQAEELLSRVVAVRPDHEDARFDLARVYALTGRYDQSFREFNVIFKSEVRFALYHTELGKILASMGLTKEARQELNRALALQPDFTPAKDQLKALEEKPAAAQPEAKPEAKPAR